MLETVTFLLEPAVAFSNVNVPVAVGVSEFTPPVRVTFPLPDVFPSYVLLFAVTELIVTCFFAITKLVVAEAAL